MKKALVVGGNSGVGLSASLTLLGKYSYDSIYIVGKDEINLEDLSLQQVELIKQKTSFYRVNFVNEDYSIFDEIQDIDTLVITAGFGRIAKFNELCNSEVINGIRCNYLSIAAILKKYDSKIYSDKKFYTAVMGSIAGHIVSPLYTIYGSSKSGLCSLIENINSELRGVTENRVLDVSPGKIVGTPFHGNRTDINQISAITDEILENMFAGKELFIPNYEEVYKDVIRRYRENSVKFAAESLEYKQKQQAEKSKPQVTVGYLSGTFDLFHVGHLNLLRRAKQECDYLVVGVHKSGAWKGKETFIPFEERVEVLKGIRYVDKVIESYPEDSDAYEAVKYNKLFVGSDYLGSERFKKYEEFFKDKGVKIVYFSYTKGTSSTQIREKIKSKELNTGEK